MNVNEHISEERTTAFELLHAFILFFAGSLREHGVYTVIFGRSLGQ
jgi:hypothetical protein